MRAFVYSRRRFSDEDSRDFSQIERAHQLHWRADMYDLESINAEQIVTATDRLLLGKPLKRRAFARGTTDLTIAARRAVVRSDERTVYMRADQSAPKLLKVLGAAAAAAWLAVAVVCLLV